MPTGLTRREGAQDNLAGQTGVEPVQLQGPGIATPRGVSVPNNSVQDRIASQLSQWGAGHLQRGVQKQQQKDVLDGQMAYAQGEALDSVKMGGNKFAVEGYMLMDAQTISSSMLAAQRQEIAQSAHTLSPEAYRERYVQRLDGMLEGKDPRTAELVREQMSQQIPALVADHTQQHMQYMENKNFESLERSVDVVSRDPTAVNELIDFATGGEGSASAGLSTERRQAATVAGVVRAFGNGNPLAYSALAAKGLLGDNLTTAEQAKIRAAQKGYEGKIRSEYNEDFFNGQQALMLKVEQGMNPTEAVEKLSILYAEFGINMTNADAGAIYRPALESTRTNNREGAVLAEEARLRGDYDTVATITQGMIMQVESGGDVNAVGPLVTGGANAGDKARGSMQVMPKTMRDPGFGVRPVQAETPEEYARVGRDYWKAMVNRYKGDVEAAAVAYNAGPANADKWVAAGRDYSMLPDQKQTQNYTRKFLGGLQNWKAPTASDKLAIAQQKLSNTRERLAMETYELITPRLADVDDMFKRGEIDEGAWTERRQHLYGTYDQARTRADVNHEIGVVRSVDTAAAAASKDAASEAYKLSLQTAQQAIVGDRLAWEEVLARPESTPAEIATATQQYAQARNTAFDANGITVTDRGNVAETETMLTGIKDSMERNRVYSEEGTIIAHATTMGYLSDLPKKLQARAFKDEQGAIVKAAQEAVADGSLPADQANDFIAGEINSFIAQAGVTDPSIRSSMSAAMRGPLIDKAGNPNPMVVDVVEQYASIKAINPHAARTFLDDDARVSAEAILSRSNNGGLIGEATRTLGLETTANPLREDATTYLARPEVQKNAERVVTDFLNTRDIGRLQAMWSKKAAQDQVWDTRRVYKTAMQSDEVRDRLRAEVLEEMGRLQQISPQFKPSDLATMAAENVEDRTEIIGGSPVFMNPGESVRGSFFGDRAGDFAHEGDVNSAVMEWLRSDTARAQYPELDDITAAEKLPAAVQAIGRGQRASLTLRVLHISTTTPHYPLTSQSVLVVPEFVPSRRTQSGVISLSTTSVPTVASRTG